MQKIFIYNILIDNIINICGIVIIITLLFNRNKVNTFLANTLYSSKTINYILLFVGSIVVMYILINSMLLDIKDISNVVNENYYEVSGKAMNKNGTNTRSKGSVLVICDNEGNEVNVNINSNLKISIGDYIKVKYLPYSKRGVIVEHKKITG